MSRLLSVSAALLSITVVIACAAGSQSSIDSDIRKQEKTINEMRDVGAAWFGWLTDEIKRSRRADQGAAAASSKAKIYKLPTGGVTMDGDTLCETLCPDYIESVPNKDAWGNAYTYIYSGNPLSAQVIVIHSGGRDGSPPKSSYEMGPFYFTEFDQDLVWADGFFIRYPHRGTIG